MNSLIKPYADILKEKDFALLILTLFIGQLATAFLLLSLVSNVFLETRSSFGVSGVVLSLAVPAFFLMAFAGVTADLFDRKKIIIGANFLLSQVVLLILILKEHVLISIGLSFLYFGVNSFFIPAVSAASSQLVKKHRLFVSNSIFLLTLYGGVILGSFLAAIVNFFFGSITTLFICEMLLIFAILTPFFLPKLPPRKHDGVSLSESIFEIARGFAYIFRRKPPRFYFFIFALTQGVIAFGTTLTPGFFDEIVGLSIEESPLFILPLVGFGVALGAILANKPNLPENFISGLGFGVIGLSALIVGLIVKPDFFRYSFLISAVSIFTIMAGFGIIISMIASRTVLQKEVSHNYQGTVFGANTVLATLFAAIASPLAAVLQTLIGYVNILIFGGITFVIASFFVIYLGKRWKY